MIITTPRTPASNPAGDQYQAFIDGLAERFRHIRGGTGDLYETDAHTSCGANGLYDLYLSRMSEPMRQHHNCNSCRRFVERYGHLVVIHDDGRQTPALWEFDAPEAYYASVAALNRAVLRAKVTGLFVSDAPVWGEPRTGEWTHMSVVPCHVYADPEHTPYQHMAAVRHEHGLLAQALAAYPSAVVDAARQYIKMGRFYREEVVATRLEWFQRLKHTLDGLQDATRRHNLVWLAAAKAPAGWCHIANNVENVVLDGIKAGKSFDEIKAAFESRADPGDYQRAQAAPTAGAIAEAERVIAGLQAQGSLVRRYARLDEIPIEVMVWRAVDRLARKVKAGTEGGVFGNVVPKSAAAAVSVHPTNMPEQTVTWAKFLHDVLPQATKLEVQVPNTGARFMALTTAVDPDATPILQWDRAEDRNPFAWYYNTGGIDAEIKRRVTSAGGQHDNVDIRCSLAWDNRNDLDLHCITPQGTHLYYGYMRDQTGGALDVDANRYGSTSEPVENIRWSKGRAPVGRYQFYVENYRFWEPKQAPTSFRVELETGGIVYAVSGAISKRGYETHADSRIPLFTIDYNGRDYNVLTHQSAVTQTAATSTDDWGVTPGQYTRVSAIVPSPNMWGKTPTVQHGNHVLFVLEGCQDKAGTNARGFLTEMCRSEFRPIRSTLEAYLAQTPVQGVEGPQACGIGLNMGVPLGLRVRTTYDNGVEGVYLIDRAE